MAELEAATAVDAYTIFELDSALPVTRLCGHKFHEDKLRGNDINSQSAFIY